MKPAIMSTVHNNTLSTGAMHFKRRALLSIYQTWPCYIHYIRDLNKHITAPVLTWNEIKRVIHDMT